MPTVLADADADTVALIGRVLAARLRAGDAVALRGEVGAGKSHLARALIRARLRDPQAEVPSPSFTLVQPYTDPEGTALVHVDLYRLADASEAVELGLDYLSEAIAIVEWPERLPQVLPQAQEIALAPGSGDDLREVTATGREAERAVRIAGFAAAAGWAVADVAPIPGDASARRWLRLRRGGSSAVLMDTAAGGTGTFARLARWLRAAGLHAPEVLAEDPAAGLMLLEDLGPLTLAEHLDAHPEDAEAALGAVADLLAVLRAAPVAPGLPALDAEALGVQVGQFAQWYAPAAGIAAEVAAEVGPTIAGLHRALCEDVPPVTALRDLHAGNLIWRGAGRPFGVIDFQDAVAAHPAYDLASALHDARRDWPPGVAARVLDRAVAGSGHDPDRFRAAFALMAAQRNLRILGIFARLARRDGKPGYLTHLPRTWAHVRTSLAHPALAPLARLLADAPAPDAALAARLAAPPDQPEALMLFAAGRGTRMAPLTDRVPKPLIAVDGRTLLDRALTLVREGGARRMVVNHHHLGAQIVEALRGVPDVELSDETEALLETGGGLRKALPLLGPGPVWTLNPDSVWTGPNPVAALAAAWRPEEMDALLMLVAPERAVAREGGGDFALGAEGRLARGGPWIYGGAQIVRPDRLSGIAGEAFSLNRLWDLLMAGGRVFGIVHAGQWCDVGRPEGIAAAEAMLAEAR